MKPASSFWIATASMMLLAFATVARADIQVRVISVEALETTFGIGDDEVFLTTNTGMRFPREHRTIGKGETWTLNVDIRSEATVILELREHDTIGGSDIIGSFAVDDNSNPGRYSAELRGDGAIYKVTYDVIATNAQTAGSQTGTSTEAPDQAQGRRWSFSNNGDNVVVLDCGDDCEEDIGVIIECTRANQPVRVEFPWVAAPTGPEGATNTISIDIDGRRFDYTATKGPNGLVGFVPRIEISVLDPWIDAIQGGRVMTVVFEGQVADIGLSGSRVALENLRSQCPRDPEPTPEWYNTKGFDSQVGGEVATLWFGIPQTDATGFSARCVVGGNGNVTVNLSSDFGNQPHNTPVSAYVQTESGVFSYRALVFNTGSESAGIGFATNIADPLWQSLANAQSGVLFGAQGFPSSSALTNGIAGPVQTFLQTCRPGAQAQGTQSGAVSPTAVQPVQPGATVTPQANQQGVLQPVQPAQPAQPGVLQPVQPGTSQPAQPGTLQPAPSTGVQPVQPGAVQPATPAPQANIRRARFTCNNGASILLSEVVAREINQIAVSINNGPDIRLNLVSQLDNGANVFSDGRLQVVSLGKTLQVSNNQTQISCQTN